MGRACLGLMVVLEGLLCAGNLQVYVSSRVCPIYKVLTTGLCPPMPWETAVSLSGEELLREGLQEL